MRNQLVTGSLFPLILQATTAFANPQSPLFQQLSSTELKDIAPERDDAEDAREEKKNDIKVNGVRENGVKFREFQTRVSLGK